MSISTAHSVAVSPASSASSRSAVARGSSPATSSRPAGSSHSRRRTACRYWWIIMTPVVGVEGGDGDRAGVLDDLAHRDPAPGHHDAVDAQRHHLAVVDVLAGLDREVVAPGRGRHRAPDGRGRRRVPAPAPARPAAGRRPGTRRAAATNARNSGCGAGRAGS